MHRPCLPCQACPYEKKNICPPLNIRTMPAIPLVPSPLIPPTLLYMPTTAAPISDFQCRPDLGFSMPADTDPPTTPSLFAAPPVAL